MGGVVGSDGDAKTSIPAVVRDISIEISRSSLVVVAGLTGSGKTSLLAGLIGECSLLDSSHGSCHLYSGGGTDVGARRTDNQRRSGGISYVPQSPWIFNATVKDNILFGSEFNEERYNAVVYACGLIDDFKCFAAGDATEIGEKGVNLSGGQQQRISLARASYSPASDIILMDDPLSGW